jgi:hypothetical protein
MQSPPTAAVHYQWAISSGMMSGQLTEAVITGLVPVIHDLLCS